MDEISPKKSTFEIKNYILKLIAYWYLFAISFFVGFIHYTISNRFAESNYSTNATIMLNDELQNTQAVVGALQLFDNRKNYENEFGVLKSFDLNYEAVKQLDFNFSYFKDEFFRRDIELYNNTPFIVVTDTSKVQTDYLICHLKLISDNAVEIWFDGAEKRYNLKFGQKFESERMNFSIEKNKNIGIDYNALAGTEYYFYKNNMIGLAKQYQNKLNVDMRSPNSSILWLWTDGSVPERIVDYINKLVEIYLKKILTIKTGL